MLGTNQLANRLTNPKNDLPAREQTSFWFLRRLLPTQNPGPRLPRPCPHNMQGGAQRVARLARAAAAVAAGRRHRPRRGAVLRKRELIVN
eukprot:gene23991-biopygen8905